MVRWLCHILIVGILAPVMACSVYNFAECDWTAHGFPLMLTGSLIGGFILQVFIWPFTLLFAFATSVLRLSLYAMRLRIHPIAWILGGAILGSGYGMFFAHWAHISESLLVSTGAVIGALSGGVLWCVWNPHEDYADAVYDYEAH